MDVVKCKFYCNSVEQFPGMEVVKMSAVTDSDFDSDGNSDDNTYAKYSPSGDFQITVSNPNVFGFFVPGNKYYFDITAENSASE